MITLLERRKEKRKSGIIVVDVDKTAGALEED